MPSIVLLAFERTRLEPRRLRQRQRPRKNEDWCSGEKVESSVLDAQSLRAEWISHCVEIVKFTVTRASVSTGCPDTSYGLKRHCNTASRAAVERIAGPLSTCRF